MTWRIQVREISVALAPADWLSEDCKVSPLHSRRAEFAEIPTATY